MKLMILDETEAAISGFEVRRLVNETIDLSDVSNNECTEIFIKNAFTMVSLDKSVELLLGLARKLRKGGTIRLNGVDSRTLARDLIVGNLDDKQYNEIVYSCKSLLSIPLMKEICVKCGLSIVTLTLTGFNYDLTATR